MDEGDDFDFCERIKIVTGRCSQDRKIFQCAYEKTQTETKPNMSSFIEITRDQGYADKGRAYVVLLDGKELGRLNDGESKKFSVAPGAHRLALKIDWCGSNEVEFNLRDQQTLKFEARSNLRGSRLFLAGLYVFFAPKKYLALAQI